MTDPGDGADEVGPAGDRRSFIKSAAGLPFAGHLDGDLVPALAGDGVASSDRTCVPGGNTVTASATTLTLLPGGSENSEPGEDGSKNACEDHREGCNDNGDDLDNAMLDYWGSWLDAWFVGDQRETLPTDLEDALDATREFPELKHTERDELRAYRLKNHVRISFPSSDSRTIDDPSEITVDPVKGDPRPSKVAIEGEDPENVPGNPTNPLSDTEENPLKALVTGKRDPEIGDWDWFDGKWIADAEVERFPSECDSGGRCASYERVELDGVDGVRASVIHGGRDPYVEKLAEIYHSIGPEAFKEQLFLNPLAGTSSVPVFLLNTPTMYTFVDLILMADGTRVARIWDASPYPRHYLYLGDGVREAEDGDEAASRVDANAFDRGSGVLPSESWPLPFDGPTLGGQWVRNQDYNLKRFLPWLLETGVEPNVFRSLLGIGDFPVDLPGFSPDFLETMESIATHGTTTFFTHTEPFTPHTPMLYEAFYEFGFGDHPVTEAGESGDLLDEDDVMAEFPSPFFPWDGDSRSGGGVRSLAGNSPCDAAGSFRFEYGGDGNTGTDEVVIPRRDLGGPGAYEVTVEYTASLQAHSGEADLKFFLRTNDVGDTGGGVRIERWGFRGGDREVTRTKTFTVDVGSDDDGIVLWCHLDSEQPGTSFCEAEVTATARP